jgi:hypothetical protein
MCEVLGLRCEMTHQVQTIYEVLALQQDFIKPRQREHDVATA